MIDADGSTFRKRLAAVLECVSKGEIENWNGPPFLDEYILQFFDVVVDASHLAKSVDLNHVERTKLLKVIDAFDELQSDFDANNRWKTVSWQEFVQTEHFLSVTTLARDALAAMQVSE